jgi:LPXTG-site transpeptidase (sortase) family protein
MSFRIANNFLLGLIIVVNLYVIAVPFVPQVLFRIDQGGPKQQALEDSLKPPATTTPATPTAKPDQANHLIVPSMLLDQPIVENSNMYRALDQGVWRWPGGSTPDKGSNTVLVGHRFTYTKPKGVFYFLDKVHIGDSIGIVWSNKTYVYRVTNTKVVHPTQTSILSPTEESTLTMYTCTPLWLPKDRLVITATLESSYE